MSAVSLNAELALAARSMNAVAERIPEAARPDLAALWGELMDEIEDCRSEGAAALAVIEWRRRVERDLSNRIVHAPLRDGA
jgi:hypothetical protein